MSQALRKSERPPISSKSNSLLIFINQIRMKIGIMFGNPENDHRGNALKFYASVRLDIRRMAAIKQGQDVIGRRTKVRIVKNKSPLRSKKWSSISSPGGNLERATSLTCGG